jgi:hypothetical protein
VKYNQPYTNPDPNAPFINGDPSIARKGSIIPAEAVEYPQREIVDLISKSIFVPDNADLEQLTKATRSQRVNWCVDQGAANLLSVVLSPPLSEYTPGLPLKVLVQNTNTASATIDAGPGRVNIKRPNGSALNPGDLNAGGIVDLVYDGTAFQMVNFLGLGTGASGGGDVNNYYINLPYAVDSSPTANIITANFSPAITTLTAGEAFLVKIANTNTGPTQININALPAINVYAQGGGALLPYDILAGSVFLFIYDGTNVYITPNPTINGNVTLSVPTTQFNTPADVFNALGRKSIKTGAIVTVQLASGVYAPFTIDHHDNNKITVQGTMIGSPPTFGSFAQTGPGAAQRASDGAANLIMLRSRYGTEVRLPAGVGNNTYAISVAQGVNPTVKDLLITSTTQYSGAGIGQSHLWGNNIAVWGCWAGYQANAEGNHKYAACWACACNFGFAAIAGGTIGGSGGAFGCQQMGVIAQADGDFEGNNFYARCNGLNGYACTNESFLSLSACDGINNGSIDCYAGNISLMTIQVNAVTFSPAPGVAGNNLSMIIRL